MPSKEKESWSEYTKRLISSVDWTKFLKALITAIATITCTLGSIYLKHQLNNQDNSTVITQTLSDNRIITSRIESIRSELNADRVSISQFHNGERFEGSNSFQNISTTHEVAADGISMSGDNFQKLPITLFEGLFEEIDQNGFVKYISTDNIPNAALGQLLSSSGVQSTYFFKLTDIEGNYMGIVEIDFVKQQKDLSNERLRSLLNESIALGAYLSDKTINLN